MCTGMVGTLRCGVRAACNGVTEGTIPVEWLRQVFDDLRTNIVAQPSRLRVRAPSRRPFLRMAVCPNSQGDAFCPHGLTVLLSLLIPQNQNPSSS
jgi:hypothetical protein